MYSWAGTALDIVVKVEVETPYGRQFFLLGACRLVAMTFLSRTSGPQQLLTDKQQATSCVGASFSTITW